MNVILLSGGSGTRLWPLSNNSRSKQFLKVLQGPNGNSESMIQRVARMIYEVSPLSSVTVATTQAQVPLLHAQLGEDADISVEPCRRDTFPAIALAACYLREVKGLSPEDPVVVCPVDAFVEKSYFETVEAMSLAVQQANLTLMGIEPTYPSEKYGYIIPDKDGRVISFKEKPKLEAAKEFIRQGGLWNGGVFAFRLGYLLEKTRELCGTDRRSELLLRYEELPRISFDYAVVEKEPDIRVLRYRGDWKDLGTWNTLTEAMPQLQHGNVITGEHCENLHVINELSIPIVALGIRDAAIVATPDGILVTDKAASSYLKDYVPARRPMVEKREWGDYKVLDYHMYPDEGEYLTKELVIRPGKSLSYQKHQHRTELWTVVKGEGLLVLEGEIRRVSTGSYTCIHPDMLHSVKALSELHIIEVQTGEHLIEEDIERFPFTWPE